MADERTRIVQWLRAAAPPPENHDSLNRVILYLAQAIERGDHFLDDGVEDVEANHGAQIVGLFENAQARVAATRGK
ncbi:hypothetical protein [Novosphingobium lentum]|uniref:hypothetical protein n=1 Tax=Novosphingobium lentum TaxID=145287 RepID=UPI00082D7886|nr:hypothetical protein [Novosphingobium lentum]